MAYFKNYKRIIIQLVFLSFLALNTLGLQAQKKDSISSILPKLTISEYYEDFDYFTKTVKNFSPQTTVRKAVTGIDALAELDKIRKKIPSITSAKDFNELILSAITVLQDGHSSFLWPQNYDDDYLREVGVSDSAISYFPAYYSLYRSINASKEFNLKLTYLNGGYYSILPFNHNGKRYASGLRLKKINGRDAAQFIAGLYPYLSSMRWDYTNLRYYSGIFYDANNLPAHQAIELEFEDENKQTITDSFMLTKAIAYDKSKVKRENEKKVEYFADEGLLYIRVPRMNLDYLDYYPEEIKSKATNKSLKKIIIDIRGNRGGADNVWVKILSSIIKKPIAYELLLLATNSQEMKAKYPEDSPNWNTYNAPFLNNHEYAVFASGERKLMPLEDSLGFEGQIYLLVDKDVYSSAGALVAVGLLADNILVIGQNTGKLLGRGINPLVFELPNSKILYRLEPVIDFQNVKSARDVYHDNVEIPVELDISQYLQRIDYDGDSYGKDFLFTHDPVFLKAIRD